MSRKIYISGPISGMPAGNIQAFMDAEKKIKDFGDVPVNPILIGIEAESHPGFDDMNQSDQWEIYMRYDIRELMLCDCAVFLPGWKASHGAMVEYALCQEVGIETLEIAQYPF